MAVSKLDMFESPYQQLDSVYISHHLFIRSFVHAARGNEVNTSTARVSVFQLIVNKYERTKTTYANDSSIPFPRRFKNIFTFFLLPRLEAARSVEFSVAVVDVDVDRWIEGIFDVCDVADRRGRGVSTKVRSELKLSLGDAYDSLSACVMDSK